MIEALLSSHTLRLGSTEHRCVPPGSTANPLWPREAAPNEFDTPKYSVPKSKENPGQGYSLFVLTLDRKQDCRAAAGDARLVTLVEENPVRV